MKKGEYNSRMNASGNAPRYCSRACHVKAKASETPRFITQCFICGKEIQRLLSRLKEKNFCSKDCSSKGRQNKGPWSEVYPDAEKRREYFRKYANENRDKINKLSSDWAKANRWYKNKIQRHRRSVGCDVSKELRDSVLSSGKCANCGSTERLEVDHIFPLSKGGKTELNNLQALCRSCNASKGNGLKPLINGLLSDKDS